MKSSAVCLLVFCCACAHAGAQPPRHLDIAEPLIITAGPPSQIALSDQDEATLFDSGSRAFSAGHYDDAALHFDRLVGSFPSSSLRLPALYNSALSFERLSRWEEALQRFDSYLLLKDEPDAQFHAALAEYKLARLDLAASRLAVLAARPGLPKPRRVEALVQEGVCKVEGSARGEGERLLRQALELVDDDTDPALTAQAEFWIGEIYRSYFREAALDPQNMDPQKLADAIEGKAQFLLSAQGHYLRAIRRGEGEWATASGFRIGELYEQFHDQLVDAPLPRDLTASEGAVYREELHKKVRVLIGKAIRIYEQTLSTAQRVGAQNSYVTKTEEALERLRKLLLEVPALQPAPGTN